MNAERITIPEGGDSFTNDDFAAAADRVNAVRDAAMSDSRIAAVVEAKTAAINRRVQTLAALSEPQPS
jgi:hypothetical protein